MTTSPSPSNALNSFERDPRRMQELAMRPYADRIYADRLGVTSIRRVEPDDNFVLDREHGIDVVLTLTNDMLITGQEKFLSAHYAKYRSLTVEYMQDPRTSEPGDWFKLACQFYFCGYCNREQNGFQIYAIVDWPALVVATSHGTVPWHDGDNRNGRARASFRWVRFDDIPKRCLIAGRF